MDALHGVQHAAVDGAAYARHAVADVKAFAGRALDVRQHPWLAVAAIALGFACGRVLARQ